MFVDFGIVIAVLFTEIVPAAIFLSAAYWAFEIRKALASPIYHRQATLQGCLSIVTAAIVFITYSNNFVVEAGIVVFYSVAIPLIFGYIDSTVTVARRSDPLLRSILGWEKLRIVGWIAVALVIILNFASLIPNSWFQTSAASSLLTLLIAIPFALGGMAILVGGRRSMDRVLRGNLKWLGLTLVFTIGVDLVSVVEGFMGYSSYATYYSYPALLSAPFWILAAYSLYRAARSLAPVNRMSLDVALKVDSSPP